MKKILFLSLLDYKDKSIQVIKLTPDAYARAGHDVLYVLGRDRSVFGSYYYEDVIEVDGVKTVRFNYPLTKLYDLIISKVGKSIIPVINRPRLALSTIYLALLGTYYFVRFKPDIVYGYEIHGIFAAQIIKILTKNLPGFRHVKFVGRYQGTILTYLLSNKSAKFKDLDHILAMKIQNDIVIMTDDGTKGDKILKLLKNNSQLLFLNNGVSISKVQADKDSSCDTVVIRIYTLSRLVKWKRVDRILHVCKELKILGHQFSLDLFGDGPERTNLEKLASDLDIAGNLTFHGAVSNKLIPEYVKNIPYFLSMYDLSNVGNPLFEAIRMEKIVFTLANGDTSSWISHGINGYIYDDLNIDYKEIAKDIFELHKNDVKKRQMISEVRKTSESRLLTWDDRLAIEIDHVENL